MGVETLRERAVKAALDVAYEAMKDCYDDPDLNALSEEITDAALAAVADAPGLEEVLRAHQMTWHAPSYRATCLECPHMAAARTLERFRDVAAAHLADVVRAWLR